MGLAMSDSSPELCPSVIDCSTHPGLMSFDLGKIPSYLSISSSSLSCLGSLLILVAYFSLKDIRTGSQKVITMLAIADFFTAFGYIVGSVNFLTHFNQTSAEGCKVFTELCEVQSFITTWSTMASYCWTCTLAFYFFLVLVFNKATLASNLMPLYNIISWIGPLLIVFPLLLTHNLGYAPYVASNWCYIKDMDYNRQHLIQKPKIIILLLLGGKFWEVASYFIVIILYLSIKIFLSKSRKTIISADSNGSQLSRVEKRLLAIPLLYILLRVWGTLQFFYSLIVDHTNMSGCIPHMVKRSYFVFGILQAIGDGGQGWGNAILYIFLSPVIRRRLFGEPCDRCLQAAEVKFQELLETETMSRSVRPSSGVPSDRISVVPSENTENEGQPATGYGVRSYRKDTSSITTKTNTTATNSCNLSLSHGTPRNFTKT